MGLQDIKETKRYGRTDGRTDGRIHARTDGQRENSIPPFKLRFGAGGGGIKKLMVLFLIILCPFEKSMQLKGEEKKRNKNDYFIRSGCIPCYLTRFLERGKIS